MFILEVTGELIKVAAGEDKATETESEANILSVKYAMHFHSKPSVGPINLFILKKEIKSIMKY